MNYVRSGVIYAAANIASAAVPFLLLPMLTRVLSPAEYGSVVDFALLVTLCQAVAGLHVHGAIGVGWFQRPRDEVPTFILTALVIAFVSTLAAALLVGAVFISFPRGSGISVQWGVVAALTAGANVVLQCRLVLWQSQNHALASAALQFGASAVNVGLTLLAVLAFGLGGDGRNAAIAAAAFLMAVVAVALFIRAKELRWVASAEHCRALLRFGAPLIVHSLAGVLISTADRWSISVRLDAAALGVYGAGAQLGMAVAIMADAFVKAYSPWMYAKLGDGTLQAGRTVVGAIYVTMPSFVVLAGVIGFTLFFFHGRTSLLASVTLTSALVGAPLTWWLVGHFGAEGAAAGFAATQGMLALLSTTTAMRAFALPWSEIRPALAAFFQTFVVPRRTPPVNPLKPGDTAP
jgi:O-antigen/teichoic acid export membrane protein